MDYRIHLSRDKNFKKLIDGHEGFALEKNDDLCLSLCGSIMSQQLSTKVAAVIYKRFLDLYHGKPPSAAEIVNTPFEKLRNIGLSNAKVRYVHNVANFAIEKGLESGKLSAMSNEEIIHYLTEIKGVGQWTAEMMLMFTLGREDVFACDDLGIQQAMIKLYKLKIENKKELREKLLKISSKWSPYRTYACLHLWHWKDNAPAIK